MCSQVPIVNVKFYFFSFLWGWPSYKNFAVDNIFIEYYGLARNTGPFLLYSSKFQAEVVSQILWKIPEELSKCTSCGPQLFTL